MERLNLSEKPAHSLQESAIHCADMLISYILLKSKVVLDIACGEGYGSALLMKAELNELWGWTSLKSQSSVQRNFWEI